MKKFLLLLLVFSFSLVSGLMTDPTSFWPNPINMSEQNSITKIGDTSYMVFSDKESKEVIFAKGENLGELEYQVIDLCNFSYCAPTLTVIDEDQIFLVYTRYTPNLEIETILAESLDGGESFQLEVQETQLLNPVISYQNGSIKLTGISGSNNQVSRYAYFSDKEESVNADEGEEAAIMKFWGRDILRGPIHSNSDIWIQQAGGGDNDGFPTFHGFVSTSGRLRVYPGGGLVESGFYADLDDIFLGGYAENVPFKELPDDLEVLEENAIHLGEGADILYIELDGNSYSGFEGVLQPHVEEFPVYSWYPADASWVDFAIQNEINWFEDSDIIHTNYVTLYDTVWTEISGNIPDGSSYYTEADLWIKGSVQGKQVWGSSGAVRLLGDIYYENTELGEFPDGFSGYNGNNEPEFNGTVNQTDYFGLISKEVMNVAYKYRDPATNEVISVSSGEQDEIFFYGAYAAVGIGDEDLYGELACHYDGVFSYEYQHPHGSTPNFIAPSPYTGNDTLYTFIDFHKYIYPIDPMVSPNLVGFNIHSNERYSGNVNLSSNGYPNYSEEYLNSCPNNSPNFAYPLGTDYPWYNPVWPESVDDIIFERGELKIIGSLVQRKRGFTHRAGSDPYNHTDSNEWDMDSFHFGGNHLSTGFDKDYYYDRRFEETELPNFLYIDNDFVTPIFEVWESTDLGNSFNSVFDFTINQDLPLQQDNYDLLIDEDNIVLVLRLVDSTMYAISTDSGENFVQRISDEIIENPHLKNNVLYVEIENTVYGYSIATMEVVFHDSDFYTGMYDLVTIGDNVAVVDYFIGNDLVTYYFTIDGGDSFDGSISQEYPILNQAVSAIKIYSLAEEDIFTIFNTDYYETMYQYGTLDGITVQEPEEVPELQPTLSNHPNPFNPDTEIRFTAKNAEDAKIEIFNIKGQKIKSFPPSSCHPEPVEGRGGNTSYSVTWNGTDQNNHPVASGIYYYTLKLDGKVEASRKMVLLK